MPVAGLPKPHAGKNVRGYLARLVDNNKAHRKKLREKRKKRDRSMPPPPSFDFEALADSTRLTEREAASVLRRSVSALQNWRQHPEHALKFERDGGRITYTVGNIRNFRKAVTK
jgi:hypothetical protein